MTSFGINNEGNLEYDYYHEDIDVLGNANVYNGQESTLWVNFRQAFPDLIKETYQDLRSNSVLNYEELIEQFITNGSDKWSESIYNEDGDFKYISMLREKNDASNLPQVRGTGEEHFRYFIENRLNYCDSKWYAGEYPDDYVNIRIYTPIEWGGVEPNASITVTPYSAMYAGVRYKANGTLYQERLDANETYTFEAPNETFNNTETAIYGASQLSSLGDLAPLYCGYIDVSNATKLTELKVGDGTEGYFNDKLYKLTLGTNRLLKKVDVRNCIALKDALGLTGCPNIEEIYATGSAITGIDLPNSGYLKIVELPATIANLTLKNQLYIERLTLEGYDAIKTITIENTPVDTLSILDNAINVERVRLTNVNWHYEDASILFELIERDIAGIDENGVNTDKMWIDGKCHIDTLSGNELAEIKAAYPYLDITYTTLTSQLIYMSEDGTTELHRETIYNGGNGTDPVENEIIETPTKESTAQYDFTHNGWSLTVGGEADANALLKVEADRYVYVSFSATIRSYTVKFYNGTTLLHSTIVEYGSDATYVGSTPTNNSTGNTADFEFTGWKPAPTNIQGDTNCYAQYYDKREITDGWDTIATNCVNGNATSKYAIGAYKPLIISDIFLPCDFINSRAVVYKDELHILGGNKETAHYKFDISTSSWQKVSTIPFRAGLIEVAVYNEEIHVVGGSTDNRRRHYKWNETDGWTSVSTLPVSFIEGELVIYNNEIHILEYEWHYKWNETDGWTSVSTLPYYFNDALAVVYNGEIHILGSNKMDILSHYKWNESDGWVEASTLPYGTTSGSAVVYNNEIHILNTTLHYKWDGLEWISVSTLPYYLKRGHAVVWNNTINIFGGSYSTDHKHYHYYLDENSWVFYGNHEIINMEVIGHNHDELADGINKWESVGTLPYGLTNSVAITYNNELHIIGSASAGTKHYKYNGSTWTEVSIIPFNFSSGSACVLGNEIHIFKGEQHYKYDGTSWTSVSILPYNGFEGLHNVVVYNNEIHMLSGAPQTVKAKLHYKWNGTEWISVSTLPFELIQNGAVVVHNSEIHIFKGTSHYKYDGVEWTSVSTLPFNFNFDKAISCNGDLFIIDCSESANGLCYKWDGESWILVGTLPYIFYRGGITVFKNEVHILGGVNYSNKESTKHYKWSIPSWEKITISIPDNKGMYTYKQTINNKIYAHSDKYLYEFDGKNLTRIGSMPTTGDYKGDGVYNNELYHFRYDSTNAYYIMYKWTENAWVEITTTSLINKNDNFNMCAVDYDGKMHIMSNWQHYTWDGVEFVHVGEMSYGSYRGAAIVFNNCIYVGGNYSNTHIMKYDGTKWTNITTSTGSYGNSTPSFFIYEGKLHYMHDWTHLIIDSSDTITNIGGLKYRHGKCLAGVCNGYMYYGLGEYATSNNMVYSYTNPRATLTFFAKNLLKDSRVMHTSTDMKWNTNYTDSDMRTWLNNDLFNALPEELQNTINEVNKFTGHNGLKAITKTNDKCWLISDEETGWNQLNSMVGEGEVYDVFTDNASRIRSKVDGEPELWLVRSVYTGAMRNYGYINENGIGCYNAAHDDLFGVCFGFCI